MSGKCLKIVTWANLGPNGFMNEFYALEYVHLSSYFIHLERRTKLNKSFFLKKKEELFDQEKVEQILV